MHPAEVKAVLSFDVMYRLLNSSSFSLDHFSDIVPYLEPDAALQWHCASWGWGGNRSVPSRDRH